jgi:phage tail sheath protein FI
LIPGIIDNLNNAHDGIISKAIDVCEGRGDAFLIYDVVDKDTNGLGTVTAEARNRDTNYGATYWPWVQVSDNQTGAFRWVPPSTVMAGIYAFNDKVAAPWFAPAGLNRGGLDSVIQAARKLTHSNRDQLYESNVNPIATFPGQGVVVWGQKTLQKKSSALDRVNVRRLLIKVKKFIAASSRFLVFEQNNSQTRERFLNIANPYLEQVQAQSGLNAFKVVMDASNNTPDIVDRNILYGQIFLQPTKTAEFIVLDFTIQPTGAAFPE